MKHTWCVIVSSCLVVMAILVVSRSHFSPKPRLSAKQLMTRVASSASRNIKEVRGTWVEYLPKTVNISLLEKNTRSRRRREVSDEVGTCTEESCVEGVCSEDKTRCVCSDGFSGDSCQYNVNECRSDPCKNEARCIDGVNRYYCDCKDGWTGDDCGEDFDECSSMPCLGRGECQTPRIAMFVCRCRSGFYGRNCENDIEECWSHPCRNGGSCVDMVDRYFCICPTGFNGTNCEEEIDECASNPCQNGGICLDKKNEFQCQCLDGFLGADCSEEVEQCRDISCENGGECVAGIDRPFCRCAEGFEGEFCDQETDECRQLPCRNSGSCIDLEADYECICLDGFEGQNCEININECKSQPCQNRGRCNDDINGYFCDCTDGFMGDQCEVDIDECASNPCQNDGECRDRIAGFHCFCTHWFTGEICDVEINACLSNPCENGGSCHEEPGSFRCGCVDGFVGERCEMDTNECSSTPCNNGGRCVDLVNRFICECASGYEGDLCEIEEDECESNPCRNNGKCIDGHHSFRCVCTRFYEGTLCELKVTFCQPNTCLNGGKCIEHETEDFVCECIDGFDGVICQRNIDECAESSCENGGLCIDGVGSYTCLCREGYQGKNCNDTTLADARKLSQTMLAIIPAAGILILCVLTISLTMWCLRRQQTRIEVPGHLINHDTANNGNTSTSNGRSIHYPETGLKNGTSTELGNGGVNEKGSKLEGKKLARDHHSLRRNPEKKHGERVSKRKKKEGSKEHGKESKEKNMNGEMRRKRRRLENGKTKGGRHERKSKMKSNMEKENPQRNQSKSVRVSIDHPQITDEKQGIRETIKTDPKLDRRKSRDYHGEKDIPARGGASIVDRQSVALTDKPTKVLDPASCKDDGRRIENVKQEVSKCRRHISTSVGEDDLNPASPMVTNYTKQAIPMQGMKSDYQSLPKQSDARSKDDSGDNIQISSPENSPIYLPVKTANGIPLYLPLGRLDHCSTYQPTIAESSPNSNEFSKRRSAESPVLKPRHSSQNKPIPQCNLSSPWQPVWKYNFPHLLMEDTQLERSFSHADERKRARTARSRSALGNHNSMDRSQLSKDRHYEIADDGCIKGRTGMQKTFLKEEIGREYWQAKENKESTVEVGTPKSTRSPDKFLSYSRHFAPPSHHITPDEEVDANEEYSQNPRDLDLFYAYHRSVPTSLKDSLNVALPKSTSELWERAELCPIATNKLDESWENDSDGDHRQGKNLARSDRLVNEFGMKNPHGMNRENAFVNGQM